MKKPLKVAIIDSGLSEPLASLLGNRILGGCTYVFDENAAVRTKSDFVYRLGMVPLAFQ
jgi:hypothetical protein